MRTPTSDTLCRMKRPRARIASAQVAGIQQKFGRVLRALDEHAVTAVAIRQLPSFSGALPPDLLDSLASRYPRQAVLDRFVVRWRP